jgi:hypothetical protein
VDANARGGTVEEIRPGDVVWCPPGVKHWHGATPATAMTHIAIAEALDGKVVEWMEHVPDEEYLARQRQMSNHKPSTKTGQLHNEVASVSNHKR